MLSQPMMNRRRREIRALEGGTLGLESRAALVGGKRMGVPPTGGNDLLDGRVKFSASPRECD